MHGTPSSLADDGVRRIPAPVARRHPPGERVVTSPSPLPTGNRWRLPNLGIGLGLRTVHYRDILDVWPDVGWFEVISENFLETAGRPLHILDRIVERYPVVLHGVALSIGSTDPLDRDYLAKLKRLQVRTRAPWVSDHLCWTGVAGHNSHDLLPLPLTEEALAHTAERIRIVQDVLGCPLMLENPSTYVAFAANQMSEWEFLARLCEQADCGLLLDVNNIYVSSRNHGFAPRDYLAGLPWDRVVQFHTAGHTDNGTHCVDTHIGPVRDEVWDLLGEAWHRAGGASVLLEWDAEIPDFATTWREALRAEDAIAAWSARA